MELRGSFTYCIANPNWIVGNQPKKTGVRIDIIAELEEGRDREKLKRDLERAAYALGTRLIELRNTFPDQGQTPEQIDTAFREEDIALDEVKAKFFYERDYKASFFLPWEGLGRERAKELHKVVALTAVRGLSIRDFYFGGEGREA